MRYNNVPRIPKRVFHDWQEAIAIENQLEYVTEALKRKPDSKTYQREYREVLELMGRS